MSHKQPLPNRGTKRWSCRYHGAKRKLRRATGILWDYNYDGACTHERIPADERRRWRKWFDRKRLAQDILDADVELELLALDGKIPFGACIGDCIDCTCDEMMGIKPPKLPRHEPLTVPLAELL
jgi:hypothetical protein